MISDLIIKIRRISTSGDTSVRYCDDGCVFDTSGSSCFFATDVDLYYIYPFMNTCVFREALTVISPTINSTCGSVAKIPIIISNDEEKKKQIKEKCKINIKEEKDDWDSFETSWDFKKHPLI